MTPGEVTVITPRRCPPAAHPPRLRGLLSLCLMLSALTLLAGAAPAAAQSPAVTKIADGLGIAWGMTWLRSDTLLFTDRSGRAGLLNTESGHVIWLSGLPEVYAHGQGGLFDVALPPDFADSGWVYFSYAKPQGGSAATTLARAQLAGNTLSGWQDLLVTDSVTDTNRHFGGRIAFDPDGHVYLSVGDRGHRPNGQDLTTHAGSILRLNPDGTAPADNPFVKRKAARPEIFSYGHRNPQGLCYDSARGGLWSSEHGPRGGDEINWITAGSNYGWAVVSHGKEYWGPFDVGEARHREGMEDPRKIYIPSIAPGSLLCYSRDGYAPWRGNLFLGALKLTHLNRVEMDSDGYATSEQRLLEDRDLRIRALLQGHNGEIIFSTDSGEIFRLTPR